MSYVSVVSYHFLTIANFALQAFIHALNKTGQPSYQELLVTVREILKAKYSQKPQVGDSLISDS